MSKPKAYYNEIDPKCCAWLQSLMDRGLIMAGIIDNRSIEDVNPDDLTPFTRVGFFSGIGGWDVALQLAGWPEDKPVWHGSCPCQPFSTAGKGAGTADERHLWPAFKWLIEQCRPPAVFGEQVASAAGREWLAGVRADLEGMAYDVGAADLCAAGVGAPHIRQRLFWVAHLQGQRLDRGQGAAGTNGRSLAEAGGGVGDTFGQRRSPLGQRSVEDRSADTRPHDAGQLSSRVAGSSEDGGLGDTRCQRDEPRRGAGDVGCMAGQEQGEAQERQRGRDVDSGAGFDNDSRLAHHHHQRSQGHGRPVAVDDTAGRQEQERHGAASGVWSDDAFWGMEHAKSDGRQQRGTEPVGRSLARGCSNSRLGHAQSGEQRRPGEPRPSIRRDESDRGSGAWSDFTLVPCRDGKARRIEPGSQPLVDGLPRGVVPVGDCSVQEAQATGEARVARLKGYGNAIVPQAAAQFILACEEAIGELLGVKS